MASVPVAFDRGLCAPLARMLALWLLLWLLFCALSRPASSAEESARAALPESTPKYFQALRRRGLFRLAENYCLERLARGQWSPADRAELTLELARTLTEHADYAAGPEQAELWERASRALDDFLQKETDNPRRLLIETQAALLPAAIGNFRRWQAELEGTSAAAAQQAREPLGVAIRRLRALEPRVLEQVRQPASARPAAAGQLKHFELRELLASVRYRLGAALVDLACLDPPTSPDRAASLLEAQKAFKSVGELGEDADVVWLARVGLAECSRLLGDPARALRESDAWQKQNPPAEIAERFVAERARALVAEKQFAAAGQLLAERERERGTLPGELALVAIQVPISEWKALHPAANARLPAALLQTLEKKAEVIRRDIGGYWAYRCDLLLGQMHDIEEFGAELAKLAGEAQGEFNAGRMEQAARLYSQAMEQARREKRDDLAFQFGFTRGSIEIKARNWADAAAGLGQLADDFPKNPKAPQAHLLAAYATGKLYDEHPAPEARDAYIRVLDEHRKKYPGDATASDAAWMLAELYERLGQLATALELFKSIPRDHKRAKGAMVAVARCYEKILDARRQRQEPVEEWQAEAVSTLGRMLPAARDRGGRYEPYQAEIALRLARILLHESPPKFDETDRLLLRAQAALAALESKNSDGAADDPQNARVAAQVRQLQVVSLAGQGRFQEARELLEQLSTSPAALLEIVDRLAPLASDSRQDPFRDLGQLQLEAALKLNQQRQKLKAADRRRLDECLARAYVATGQARRGIEIYEGLLARAPRDKRLLASYGDLLVRCGNDDCLKKAVDTARQVEELEQPGSEDWFAARYEVCRALVRSRQPKEAAKLLKLTRLLYPKIESEDLQKKYSELETEVDSRR